MALDLLIPGTGGITLMDDAGNDLGYPVRMKIGAATGGLIGKSARELVALLSMQHTPGQVAPVKTSLEPGVNLRAGRPIDAAYNQYAGFNAFNYDWRADLRWNARHLLDLLEQRTPAGQRWNLVGHSQGGLLIVLASKLLRDPDAFSARVRSVTLVGAPLAGAVNSARALIRGEQLGAANRDAFRRIVRSWPAIYQMLPSWDAVVDARGQPVGRSLLEPATWRGHPGIEPDFLERAQAVQELLADPLDAMGSGTKAAILMAENRWTDVDLVHDGRKLNGESVHESGGDTLVPFGRTLDWLGDRLSGFVVRVGSGTRQHSMLMNDPTVVSIVQQQRR